MSEPGAEFDSKRLAAALAREVAADAGEPGEGGHRPGN